MVARSGRGRARKEREVDRSTLGSEIAQTFLLMALMAAMLAGYVGLGLLAARVLA